MNCSRLAEMLLSLKTLCHSKWVTKEKGSNAKTNTEGQNCFTTKDAE